MYSRQRTVVCAGTVLCAVLVLIIVHMEIRGVVPRREGANCTFGVASFLFVISFVGCSVLSVVVCIAVSLDDRSTESVAASTKSRPLFVVSERAAPVRDVHVVTGEKFIRIGGIVSVAYILCAVLILIAFGVHSLAYDRVNDPAANSACVETEPWFTPSWAVAALVLALACANVMRVGGPVGVVRVRKPMAV